MRIKQMQGVLSAELEYIGPHGRKRICNKTRH